jgi:hypothetical protein
VLIREAFPGIVKYKGRDEPAWHWQQYDSSEDTSEEQTFDSALQRVEECFWVSLTCSVYYHISCYQHKSFVVVFYVLVFAVVVQMAKWQGACSKESSAQCREEAHTTNVL